MLAGTYMAEYGRYSKLTMVVRFINDILLSAPSIVIGLFVYEVLVAQIGHFSGIAGAVALAVLVVPVVVRTTEDMLLLVPEPAARGGGGARPAALALSFGASPIAPRVGHRHRRAAGRRPRQRRDGAAAVHRAQQSVLEHRSQRADVEPAGRHLPIRAQPLQGMAAAGLDRRPAHHRSPSSLAARSRARCAQHAEGKNTTMTAHAGCPKPARICATKVVGARPRFLLWPVARAESDLAAALRQQGDGLHRPVGLRQVDAAARAEPHVRPLSRSSAPRARCCSTARTFSTPRIDLNLLRSRVGMVFQKPTPFPMSIYDNIAFGIRLYEKLLEQRARRPRRGGAARRGACGTR